MLQLHAAHYPESIQELRGLADGAGLPFEQVGIAMRSSCCMLPLACGA
jgi:hypothetical protein